MTFFVFSFSFSFCASGWIFSPDLFSSSQILSSVIFKLILNLLWGSYFQSSHFHLSFFFCFFHYFWNYPSCYQFPVHTWSYFKVYYISDICISVDLLFFVFPVFWLFGLLVCLVFLMACWTVHMKTVEIIWGCCWWYPPLEDFLLGRDISLRLWAYPSIQLEIKQIQS